MKPTTTDHVLMVRPANFGFNPETAADNAFQMAPGSVSEHEIARRARQEFDGFAAALEFAGVEVTMIEDTKTPEKADAVFPNNWLTTHTDGTVITYPIYSPNRRLERRHEIIETLRARHTVTRHLTLESWEERPDMILEGTGALILDRTHRIAYACLSKRCTEAALQEWCEMSGYEPVAFNATDPTGLPIYHTNVMMAVGENQVVVAASCILAEERQGVLDRIAATGKTIVELSWAQVARFAGNMLQVRGKYGLLWAMSSQAYGALEPEQVALLQNDGSQIVHADLDTIETYGGGSARCMLAEVYLSKR